MSHRGHPKIHSHSAMGADSKVHSYLQLKLDSKQLKYLTELNKDFIQKEYIDEKTITTTQSILSEASSKRARKNLSYAIFLTLMANVSNINHIIENSFAKQYAKIQLYQIISLLDLPSNWIEFLIKTFKLQDIERMNFQLREIFTSPEFQEYRKEISKYLDMKVMSASSYQYTDIPTYLLYLYSFISRKKKLPQRILGYIDTRALIHFDEKMLFIQQYTEAFDLLKKQKIFDNVKHGDLKPLKELYDSHDFGIYSYEEIEKYGFVDDYIFSLFKYYAKLPVSEFPPVLLSLLLITQPVSLYPEDGHIFLYYDEIPPNEAIENPHFQMFAQEVCKTLYNTKKSPMQLLYELSINEHKILSQRLKKLQIPDKVIEEKIEEFKESKEEIYEAYINNKNEFNRFIDYLAILIANPGEEHNRLYRYYLYIKDKLISESIKNPEDDKISIHLYYPRGEYTLKYLLYNPIHT